MFLRMGAKARDPRDTSHRSMVSPERVRAEARRIRVGSESRSLYLEEGHSLTICIHEIPVQTLAIEKKLRGLTRTEKLNGFMN